MKICGIGRRDREPLAGREVIQMKFLLRIYPLLVITFLIVGCGPATPSAISTQTESRVLSPTVFPSAYSPLPTHTKTLTPTATLTLTPPIPLGSEEAQATIQALLREPVDCAAPCFWGIVPGRTTLGEARNIFTQLGILYSNTTYTNPAYKGGRLTTAEYDFFVEITLVMRDDVVTNLQVGINPEEQKVSIPREWQAYSPETLINRYGTPSKILLDLEWGPSPLFDMVIYFDEFDLIVEYAGYNIIPRKVGSPEVCPLTAQFDMVWLWMGKDPVYPPLPGVSVEKATGMTPEEFSKLMTGDPDKACFIVKAEEFLP
jgi:hypothetical protein